MGVFKKSDKKFLAEQKKRERELFLENFTPTLKIDKYFQYDKSTGNIVIKPGDFIPERIINIKDIIDYKIIGDKETIGGFGIGTALSGAILTGGIGLLAGFTKKNSVIYELTLQIITNDEKHPFINIQGITKKQNPILLI